MPTGTPVVEGKAAEAAKAELAQEQDLLEKAQNSLQKAKVKSPSKALQSRFHAFVNPTEPTTRYLVRKGEVVRLRDQNSATGFRDTSRETPGEPEKSDKWAVFRGGILVTDDPEIIAWCQEHDTICRDANAPGTEFWFNVKRAQIPLANQDPSLDQGIDVDAALRGEGIAPTKGQGGAVSSARQFAEVANERAGD
jgi:hypothetical protein